MCVSKGAQTRMEVQEMTARINSVFVVNARGSLGPRNDDLRSTCNPLGGWNDWKNENASNPMRIFDFGKCCWCSSVCPHHVGSLHRLRRSVLTTHGVTPLGRRCGRDLQQRSHETWLLGF